MEETTCSKENKNSNAEPMKNSDRFTYIHSRYNKEFEIKENIEQKSGLLLTAIGLYLSVLLINIFSNNVTTLTKFGIVTSVEFIYDFNFDINVFCSISLTLIIYNYLIKKNSVINIYVIGLYFSIFIIYVPIILVILYISKNITGDFFNLNIKIILFFSIIILLLLAIFKLIKCINNSNYKMMNFYNTEEDVKNIFKINYEEIIKSLIEYTKNNIEINKIKAMNYKESIRAFYITIILTLLYLI